MTTCSYTHKETFSPDNEIPSTTLLKTIALQYIHYNTSNLSVLRLICSRYCQLPCCWCRHAMWNSPCCFGLQELKIQGIGITDHLPDFNPIYRGALNDSCQNMWVNSWLSYRPLVLSQTPKSWSWRCRRNYSVYTVLPTYLWLVFPESLFLVDLCQKLSPFYWSHKKSDYHPD